MPTRRAFARSGLLLAVMAGVGAATLLGTAEPVHAPERQRPRAVQDLASYFPHEPDPCPRFNIPLADGRKVSLADLRPGMELEEGCDLQGADWHGVNLSGVVTVGADLHGANLRGACLRNAVLAGANLTKADLRGADLRGANLVGDYCTRNTGVIITWGTRTCAAPATTASRAGRRGFRRRSMGRGWWSNSRWPHRLTNSSRRCGRRFGGRAAGTRPARRGEGKQR
jgi:hypothetical protein